MATRRIVPRADGEGGLGTSVRKWGPSYFTTINADNFKVPTEDKTVFIPTDYGTLQDAIDDLSKIRAGQGHKITIMIESGHVIDSGMAVKNRDLSIFEIDSEDPVVNVNVNDSDLFNLHMCTGLRISALFNFEENSSEKHALYMQNSVVYIGDGAGFENHKNDFCILLQSSRLINDERNMICRNSLGEAISGSESSFFYTRNADITNNFAGIIGTSFFAEARYSDISGTKSRAIDCGSGCYFSMANVKANDSGNEPGPGDSSLIAVRCSNGSSMSLWNAEVKNAGGTAISMSGGASLDARDLDCSGAGYRGIYITRGSRVTFVGGNARKTLGEDSPEDVVLRDGAIVNVTDATCGIGNMDGETLERNTVYRNGIAFDKFTDASSENTLLMRTSEDDTGVVSTPRLNGVIASTDSQSSAVRGLVLASMDSVASGLRNLIIGSRESSASGSDGTVISGLSNDVDGSRSSIIASTVCENNAMNALIVGSTRAANNKDNVLVMGDASSGDASTANRSIELNSVSGDITISGTVSSGASFSDFAEMMPNEKLGVIPIGSILAFGSEGVRLAEEGDEIVGVVSGTAAVIAGNDNFCWAGRYVTDEWGRTVYEDIPDPDYDGDGEPHFISVRKENPEWDATKEQVSRKNRPHEWTVVGMMGQVYVKVDESVLPGDRVRPSHIAGTGTKSSEKSGLRAMFITQDYNPEKGYAVAKCLVNIQP